LIREGGLHLSGEDAEIEHRLREQEWLEDEASRLHLESIRDDGGSMDMGPEEPDDPRAP